jgi:hypothetical protein
MPIDEHLSEFEGRPVIDYSVDLGVRSARTAAYRVALDWAAYDEGKSFVDLFASFVAEPAATDVQALLIGNWGGSGEGNGSAPVVEALVSARDRLPKLRALFLGEITVEESEISWITQSDVSPLFNAFPRLEALFLRGGNDLRLGRPRHENLRKLVIETGGMASAIVREVTAARLPRLQHLELWLGDDGYGNDVTLDDIRMLLTQGPCSNLTYLGLRDDCRADETAELLGETGVPATLQVLDLSLGTLGDEGAGALADCAWLRQLAKLDIHHHYAADEVVARLRTMVRELDASDKQEPDVWGGEAHRYVAVGE